MTKPLNICLGAILAASLLAAGCGNEIGTGAFPRLLVLADEDPIASESAGEVSFGQALQLPVRKQVQLINPGFQDVTISDIGWQLDETTGLRTVNPHVSIDWRGQVDPNQFPVTILAGDAQVGITFDVVYNPPIGQPLTDFSPSVLVIKSNARIESGAEPLPEITVTFTMPQKLAAPTVNPPNLTFNNATPTAPETHEFSIDNDEDIATAPFNVLAIDFDRASNEFILTDLPSLPFQVLEPAHAGYAPATFKVTYTPQSGGSGAINVRVFTDVITDPIIVPLKSGILLGSWAVSYEFEKRFDFTNVNEKQCRSAIITSEGPGPLKVKEPEITPAEARQAFDFVCYKPATKPGEDDEPIDGVTKKYPQALAASASIRCEVCFEPPAGGVEPANGQLIVPVEDPSPTDIVFDLFAGAPKPKMVLGPVSGQITVSADKATGETGVRRVFVYNEGNGNLEIKDVFTEKVFPSGSPSEVFSLVTEPTESIIVAPNAVHLIEVAFDAALIDEDTASELVKIVYFDPFSGEDQTESMQLIARDSEGAELPVADLGDAADYAGAVVGAPVALNGSGSTPGALEFEPVSSPYIWNLVAKPAGSLTRLNANTSGPAASFTPDVAGTYEVSLIVFSQSSGGEFLYSEPASVQIQVAE